MRIDSPIITGSFSVNGDSLLDLNTLTTTGSNTFIGNQSIIGAISASALTGSIDFTNLTNSPTLVSGSSQIVGILSSLNSVTASFTPRISNLESKSSSVDISISNINSVTASNIARLTNLESKSASVDISITNINSYTSSQDTKNTTVGSYTGSNDTKWTSIGNLTGSYATTGSNTFFGTQTYSGSVYIANDLIVQGSSSIQYISASSVSIGTNIVQLNTANPSVRFAGLTIIDSGSIGGSGSFLYDSVHDEFVFVHRGNGTNVTSSHFVLGPETYDSLGNETYLTCNVLTKGTGKEHLVDSCIFDNGTTTCIKNNFISTGTGLFCGQLNSITGVFGNKGGGNYGVLISDNDQSNVRLRFTNSGTSGQSMSIVGGNPGLSNQGLSIYDETNAATRLHISCTGVTTLSCQLYLDGCNRDMVFVKSNNSTFSRLFYAGQNQIVFHNGNTTACGGAWGLNNYEDTVGLFRVYNSGISCWFGNKMVCGNIGLTSTSAKFYQQTTNCKSADSVLDIYNTATDGFGVSIQAGANNTNYALAVTNYASTPLLHVAGNGYVGIGCGIPNAKLTINSQSTISSINIYGCNSSYISQVGWFDTTNLFASDGIGGNRVALIEIGTVAGTGTGCRGANMGLYTHEANGGLKLPLLLMHNGNVCLPQGNLYTTCTLFAPGTPIQVVTGTATVTSGAEGTGCSLVSNAAGTTPAWNDGLQIASTSFTPKSASSKILVMTNSVVMWERSNVSDHFYLWASNYTDGIVLVKSGQRLMNFGSGYHNGGVINLNGAFSSWGASAKTISFRIGSTGGSNASFEWNPYYGAGGFNADTVGNFTYTIMEIAQ